MGGEGCIFTFSGDKNAMRRLIFAPRGPKAEKKNAMRKKYSLLQASSRTAGENSR